MKKLVAGAACALLLAACASGPESAATSGRDCRSTDAPTGSHLVRRSQCDHAARAGDDGPVDAQQLQEAQRALTAPGLERR